MTKKRIQILLFVLGAAVFAVVLRNFDAEEAFALAVKVKWGFLVIFFQETVAHAFNTLGWKYAMDSELNIRIKFGKLFLMRIAGDAINYVTPSATLAGEFARAHLMGSRHDISHRLSTVALAKITQTAAMALVSAAALAWFSLGDWDISALSSQMKAAGGLIAVIFAVIIALEIRAAGKKNSGEPEAKERKSLKDKVKELDRVTMLYVKKKPANFFLSVLFFTAAYLWGAVEAYLILYFLGFAVSLTTALLIEMLAVFLDGLFFAVPMKAGTQEATKIAIFGALKFPASLGLSFGITRHLREILWALAGLIVFYALNSKTQVKIPRQESGASLC